MDLYSNGCMYGGGGGGEDEGTGGGVILEMFQHFTSVSTTAEL